MGASLTLAIIAALAFVVLCAAATWAFVELARTARVMRDSTSAVEGRLVPLIEKADVSLDLLNAEVLRVDSVISQMEQVSGRVTSTSEAVTEVVRAPIEFLVGLTGGRKRDTEQTPEDKDRSAG